MSRSSKPRKKYRPKYTEDQMRSAPKDAIFSRSEDEVEADAAESIIAALRISLIQARNGKATYKDFNSLSAAANVSIVLCEKGVGAEFYGICRAASMELARCRYQYDQIGKFLLSEDAAKTVAEMIEVREAQFLAEGYTSGLDYQAAAIAHKRLTEGNVIKPEDLEVAP